MPSYLIEIVDSGFAILPGFASTSINQSIKNKHLQKWPVVNNVCVKSNIKPKDIYEFFETK